jgi:hypothetical protein
VETDIDESTKAGCDVAVSVGERVGEDGGNRASGVIDDARVALKLVTKPVIVIGQESPGSMQCSEDLICVLARARLALRAGAEPEPAGLGLQVRRAAPASMAQPVCERTLDREDALLPLSLLGSYCDRAASEPNDGRTTLKFGSRKG